MNTDRFPLTKSRNGLRMSGWRKKTPVLPEGAADWVFLSHCRNLRRQFAAQEKWSGAAGKKRRIAIYVGLLLLAVIGVVVIFFLKNAKHHWTRV